MKKYLFLSFALLTSYSALAQSKEVLSGDYNNDGEITVADVTYMSEIILGHKQPVYITSPQAVDLEFKGQAFVDPTGTFPQFFKYDEGQGINVIGMRGQAWNSIYVNLNTVEEDGFTGHSDGGVFSLRQDETQYMVASGFSEYSVDENGQLMLTFDYGRYSQWYNGNEKHLRDDYNYVVSKPTSFADGKVSFEVYNLSALVRLSLSGLPANTWVVRVELEASDGAPIFAQMIEVNPSADNPIVKSEDAYTNTVFVNLQSCYTSADGKLDVYMLMGPADLSGKKLNVLTYINNMPFRAEVQGQNMVSNHCYTYEAKDATPQFDKLPLELGENTVSEEGEYYFVPASDGAYEVTSTGGFEVYYAQEIEPGSYQMQAGIPYGIMANGASTITITKKEYPSFVLGEPNKVGNATYYELTLPTAGYYYFKSGKDENYMWTNRIGEYPISFDNGNCYYLEAGSCYIRFNDDDQITIGAATPLTLGSTNTVEAYSYYTFNPSEDGLYRFSSDVDNHIYVWGANNWNPDCDTPQSMVLSPEEQALYVKVWNAGKLTIEKVEVQEIALGTDTQVKANFEDNHIYTFYQFVVTEKGFYHIQMPEGYNMEITSQGVDRNQQLEPGTYYIRFYHWNWNNPQDQNITVKISKTAGEAEDIDDPYASNTVQLSTEENAVYYQFRPTERGIYRLNVGDGCNFEILHRGSARFMELNDWEEYYVRFWSKTDDASMTSTTFSISKAEVEEMAVGDWVDVSTDKLYRLVGMEEGEAEYYFSAKGGYHIACSEWRGDLMENNRHRLWAGEECHLYFYHDTNSATTTQARVKKFDREKPVALPLGEEVTVELGTTLYTFTITEEEEYNFIMSEGVSYYVEEDSYGWYEPGTYHVTFYNYENPSQLTTTLRIVKANKPITLGVPCDLTYDVTRGKIVIEEEDYYHIAISEGWSYQIEGMGWVPDIVHLDPDTYYLRFMHDEGASETGSITIEKLANDEITIGKKKTITNKWYKLTVVDDGVFDITITNNSWMCEILGRGRVTGTVSLTAGTYYLRFTPTGSGTSTSVIITEADTEAITCGESFVVNNPDQYYTLEVTEGGFYKLEISEGWECHFVDWGGYWENGKTIGMEPGLVTFYFEQHDSNYPEATVTISKPEAVDLSEGENATTRGPIYNFTPSEEGFYAISGNITGLSAYECEQYGGAEGVVYLYLFPYSQYTFEVYHNEKVTITRDVHPAVQDEMVLNKTATFYQGRTYKVKIAENGNYRLNYEGDYMPIWLGLRGDSGSYGLTTDMAFEIPAGVYYFVAWMNEPEFTATLVKE